MSSDKAPEKELLFPLFSASVWKVQICIWQSPQAMERESYTPPQINSSPGYPGRYVRPHRHKTPEKKRIRKKTWKKVKYREMWNILWFVVAQFLCISLN